jgi:DNA-binding protein HU-beta
MNKSDLITAVADQCDLSKTAAALAVETTLQVMAQGIADGKLELHGFGNFTVKTRAARTGRNPKTGEPMQIAAKRNVGFKAASKLKAAVNPKGGA